MTFQRTVTELAWGYACEGWWVPMATTEERKDGGMSAPREGVITKILSRRAKVREHFRKAASPEMAQNADAQHDSLGVFGKIFRLSLKTRRTIAKVVMAARKST